MEKTALEKSKEKCFKLILKGMPILSAMNRYKAFDSLTADEFMDLYDEFDKKYGEELSNVLE